MHVGYINLKTRNIIVSTLLGALLRECVKGV